MRHVLAALLLLPLFAGCAGNDGTGRQDWPRVCPNPSSNQIHYMHDTWADRSECHAIDFVCPDADQDGTQDSLRAEFPNRMERGDCGCGCFYPDGDKPGTTSTSDDPEPSDDTGLAD